VSHQLRLAGLLGLLLPSLALAAAPPPRPLGPVEIQRLIEQLGDRDYRARERAERRLVAEGLPALPLLRKALGSKDPEVRRRALRLVPGLEHAALVAPKRINLTVKNQPLRIILEQLSKQTGYKIQHMGGAPQMFAPVAAAVVGPVPPGRAGAPREETFTYNFVNTPFLDVIERLCRDAHLVLQQGWGDDTVRLYHGGGVAPHTGRDGAFRYAAANLQMYRNVELSTINPRAPAAPPRQESLTFNIALFAEPRLPFLGAGEVRLEVAYDSERNSLIPRDASGDMMEGLGGGMRFARTRYYGGGHKQMSMQVGFNLNRVSEKATTIKVLKGVVPVTLLVEQKPIIVADNFLSSKGKKTLAGDVEFNIENVQKMANNQFQVKFTATNKAGGNDYSWTNSLYQRLELQDAKGQKYQNWGSSWHGGAGNNQVTMTLTYSTFGGNKVGPPTRLVYQHWITRQHDVHFSFRDVPLP
jgi:hypothetical protein